MSTEALEAAKSAHVARWDVNPKYRSPLPACLSIHVSQTFRRENPMLQRPLQHRAIASGLAFPLLTLVGFAAARYSLQLPQDWVRGSEIC